MRVPPPLTLQENLWGRSADRPGSRGRGPGAGTASRPQKELTRRGNSRRNRPTSQGLAELVSAGQWSVPEKAGPQAAPRPPLEVMEPRAGWQRKDHMGLGTCRLWLWPASLWMDTRSGERLQGSGHHPSRGWWGQLPLHPHLGASPPSESRPCVPLNTGSAAPPPVEMGGGRRCRERLAQTLTTHAGTSRRHSPTHTRTPILPSPTGASQPSQHTAAVAVILSWGPGDIIYHPPDT